MRSVCSSWYLDAIDYRMRSVKGNLPDPFGGECGAHDRCFVSIAPIVRDNDGKILRSFIQVMHFFWSPTLALRNLDGLPRVGQDFPTEGRGIIECLNHLRINEVNSGWCPVLILIIGRKQKSKKLPTCIMITTHNYKADQAVQSKRAGCLNITSFFTMQEVEDDFPESRFPLPKTIELREGAQIMFVKNGQFGSSEILREASQGHQTF